MFCFTNILNIFFSFVTCSMHKNPHQNAGNGIETLFFKIFVESMLPDPPRGSHAFGASRANSCLPPKFLSLYAYVPDHMNTVFTHGKNHETYDMQGHTMLGTNLVPRLFLRGRKDPGRSWSRATQNLGGKLKKHLGRGGRVLRLENYNLCA